MRKTILLWFGFLLIGAVSGSCDSDPEQGNVVFYTQIQAYLNCGEFGVDIMIEDEKMGTLEKPFLPFDGLPDCESMENGTVLSLSLTEGDFQVIAVANCGGDLRDTVLISVVESECSPVEVFEID